MACKLNLAASLRKYADAWTWPGLDRQVVVDVFPESGHQELPKMVLTNRCETTRVSSLPLNRGECRCGSCSVLELHRATESASSLASPRMS